MSKYPFKGLRSSPVISEKPTTVDQLHTGFQLKKKKKIETQNSNIDTHILPQAS